METSAGHDKQNTEQRLLLVTQEFIPAGTELTLLYEYVYEQHLHYCM